MHNLSQSVNVVCKGSPSRIRIVLLISLGITTRPRPSILLTFPLAVPDSALTLIVAQSSTAALRFARCITHRVRSQPHLLLSYMHFSLNYKLCCILRANASNKVRSGVKISNFGNTVWFLLSVIVGDLYCTNLLFKSVVI